MGSCEVQFSCHASCSGYISFNFTGKCCRFCPRAVLLKVAFKNASISSISSGFYFGIRSDYMFHVLRKEDNEHIYIKILFSDINIDQDLIQQSCLSEPCLMPFNLCLLLSPVEGMGTELVNPCYAGNHDCDTTAQCIPLEGQSFQCKCATGYRGDGRNCYGTLCYGYGTCGTWQCQRPL